MKCPKSNATESLVAAPWRERCRVKYRDPALPRCRPPVSSTGVCDAPTYSPGWREVFNFQLEEGRCSWRHDEWCPSSSSVQPLSWPRLRRDRSSWPDPGTRAEVALFCPWSGLRTPASLHLWNETTSILPAAEKYTHYETVSRNAAWCAGFSSNDPAAWCWLQSPEGMVQIRMVVQLGSEKE